MMIDVNEIRIRETVLHGLTGTDKPYTLYCDETNNDRRLHIRPDGLNVREPGCFVVGGIAHLGPTRNLDLGELRQLLRIQESAKEIKLTHVAKEDFLALINDERLGLFLRWLLKEGFFIHYSALDPMYWSTVDIIDSILTAYGNDRLYATNWELKDALYTVLRHDMPDTVALFGRYSYPDVGRERRSAFVGELLERLEVRFDLLEHFPAMMLKGVLQIGTKLDSLTYLEDETPNMLIGGFSDFFIQRICIFKNSSHIFDVEKVVEKYINEQTFVEGDRQMENYRFAVSHDEPAVQVSDVVVGLLGNSIRCCCVMTGKRSWKCDAA